MTRAAKKKYFSVTETRLLHICARRKFIFLENMLARYFYVDQNHIVRLILDLYELGTLVAPGSRPQYFVAAELADCR